jgi:hypothetical protein
MWWLAPLGNASRLSLSLLIDHASDLRPDKSARKEAYTPARIEARPVKKTRSRSDYRWIYIFYIDVPTQRITAKRFYITDLGPLPFRLIFNE